MLGDGYVGAAAVGGAGRFLAATSGRVWMTEQGGVVRRKNADGSVVGGYTPEDVARANRALAFQLNQINARSSRITRSYVYQWTGDDIFDSGLLDHRDGSTRTLYDTFKSKTVPTG